ncbi:MAG: hypothetical protein U0556_08655 [Dehalococcoidia bacterium]
MRYLTAKVSLDDRSLNPHVLGWVRGWLAGQSRLRVLEAGAGIGTMVERLLRWRLVQPERSVEYVVTDADRRLLALGATRLERQAAALGYPVQNLGDCLRIGEALTVRFEPWDVTGPAGSMGGPFDLVIAHHLLDLLDLEAAVPVILGSLRPGGAFWFTLNADGKTAWAPEVGDGVDDVVEGLYHASMDRHDGSAHSRTGRRLPMVIRAAGGALAAIGGSDWAIAAGPDGFRADDQTVLEAMLDFHRDALADDFEPTVLDGWIRTRKDQLERGELVLVVSQVDVAGTVSSSESVVQPASSHSASANSA